VLVGEARAAAKEWVSANAAGVPGFRGAFFSGSTAVLSSDITLPTSSDVDVVVVVASSIGPSKLGKLRDHDALLEVTYLPSNQFAHVDTVAVAYGAQTSAGSA
jgi:hypothetical protein